MIGRWRAMTIAIVWLAPAACLMADTLPLDASYGNKDGCAYAKSGESTGSDDFVLLTKEAITTAASYCTFKKIGSSQSASKGTPITLSCQDEGEENPGDFDAVIGPAGKNSMEIRFADGSIWGPLERCR